MALMQQSLSTAHAGTHASYGIAACLQPQALQEGLHLKADVAEHAHNAECKSEMAQGLQVSSQEHAAGCTCCVPPAERACRSQAQRELHEHPDC